MADTNLTGIHKRYRGQWVALKRDRTVIVAAKTLKVAAAQARKRGYANPLFLRVPSSPLPLFGQWHASTT